MAENLAANNAHDVLERFSAARVAPYRSATANDHAALELYRWNMVVAGTNNDT